MYRLVTTAGLKLSHEYEKNRLAGILKSNLHRDRFESRADVLIKKKLAEGMFQSLRATATSIKPKRLGGRVTPLSKVQTPVRPVAAKIRAKPREVIAQDVTGPVKVKVYKKHHQDAVD